MELLLSLVGLVASLLAILGVVWGFAYRYGRLQACVDQLEDSAKAADLPRLKILVEQLSTRDVGDDLSTLKSSVDEIWKAIAYGGLMNNQWVRRGSAFRPTEEGLDRLPQETKTLIERGVQEGSIKAVSDLPVALREIGGIERLYEIGDEIGIRGDKLYGILWAYASQLLAQVEVVHDDGSVEVVDVDEYVKGVLPYEMGTGWPMEALKAQAIVAKSYAVAARRVYTDTRSQVYGPLRYPDTDAAVDAVRDTYLGYQGKIVMPFYFAHCTGRTRSPSEAGWEPVADRPYLAGVPCTCGRRSYYGYGIGMCQRGAEAMAEQGATFDQILSHYYQGIELLRLKEAPRAPTIPAAPANAVTYVVQPGDSLSAIAARFGTTWQALHRANAEIVADPNIIQPGQGLVIPRSSGEEGEDELYIVQPGDSLSTLGQAWGCSVDDIVKLNSMASPDLIRVGQRLRKP